MLVSLSEKYFTVGPEEKKLQLILQYYATSYLIHTTLNAFGHS